MSPRLLLGTSGYVYPHWRGRFYPREVPQRLWLPYYAERFDTVELNNPFYRLPAAETFAAWRQAVDRRFLFAVKASRFLTHNTRLRDPEAPLRLLLQRARHLGPTLGPLLFQLPGNFHVDLERLEGFLHALRRQRWVRPLRAVLEVRHPSWLVPAVTERLTKAGVALCLSDWREATVRDVITADFVYLRRHGARRRYGGAYPDASLRQDARAIRRWLDDGRDVYVYFNNDGQAHAIYDAARLRSMIAGASTRRPTRTAQPIPANRRHALR